MPDVRPVWLTLADRNALLQALGFCAQLELAPVLRDMAAAWDAAPADPTEAVLTAIDQGYIDDADEAAAVLRALGMPHA